MKRASLIAQLVKNLPSMQGTLVRCLSWEDLLEKDRLPTPVFLDFPGGSASKESTCNAVSLRRGLKQARDRGAVWKNDGGRHRQRLTPPVWGTIPLQVLGTHLFLAVLQGRHIADLTSLSSDAHRLSFHWCSLPQRLVTDGDLCFAYYTHTHTHAHTHTPCLTSYYIFEYLLKVSEDKESARDRHYTHFVGSSLKEA